MMAEISIKLTFVSSILTTDAKDFVSFIEVEVRLCSTQISQHVSLSFSIGVFRPSPQILKFTEHECEVSRNLVKISFQPVALKLQTRQMR